MTPCALFKVCLLSHSILLRDMAFPVSYFVLESEMLSDQVARLDNHGDSREAELDIVLRSGPFSDCAC